ncbi:MAG: hypothetical protein AUG48_05680 [Actinobacteria bacterium 13_1_20CM_3_68_9]|nr:MAG: hypothetical protein AUG48_05680 [Actinobacteria bacterium 13_1_20CM_3_68_9]
MTRIRARVAIMALVVALPAALAGCGGGGGSGGSEDPNQVLDQTFNNPTKITSGNLGIALSGSAEGSQSGSLTATIDGPFQGDTSNPASFPQLELTAKISASGQGQSFSFDGGLIATKDNAYVQYQGQAYEVGSSIFQRFKTAYEQSAKKASSQQRNQSASSIFQQFGIDPKTWLTNVSNVGDESVNGQDTIHIHGDANVQQIISDLSKIAQQAPGATAQALTPAQLDQLKSAIKQASVDVYSGKDDHLLRKLSLSLSIVPPSSATTSVSSVKLDFSVTINDVNQAQTITAPSGAKPISGLLSQLGISGLGPLGGLGGGTNGGGSVGGGGGPSQAYLKCVQQASSASQLSKCASKLQ